MLLIYDDHEWNTLGLQKHADYVQLVLALFPLSLQYQCRAVRVLGDVGLLYLDTQWAK